MNESAANFFKLRLRDTLIGAFSEGDLADFFRTKLTGFDWDKQDQRLKHKEKAREAIDWKDQHAGMKGVQSLAEDALKERPDKDELKKVVAEIKALVEGTTLPKALADALSFARIKKIAPWNLAVQFRNLLRDPSVTEHDLPGRFHLSDEMDERLLALLALEARPNPAYLRWLAERVTVEPPLLAALAAKVLIAAARQLDLSILDRLKVVLQTAQTQLKELVYADPPAGSPFPVDVSAREDDLRVAETLVEIRTKIGLLSIPKGRVDEFLRALIESFDRAKFAAMCDKHLGGASRAVSHETDPIELVVVYVAVRARKVGYIPNLIWAAYEEQQGNVILESIHNQFGGGVKPQPMT